MENKKKNIARTVKELVKDAVEECGCKLWDVTFTKEGSDFNLTIYIDKDGGVSLTDCEMVNDAVDPIIEEADPISGSYYLEISSPGLERELNTFEQIDAFTGNKVELRFFTPYLGSKVHLCRLLSCDEEKETVRFLFEDGTEAEFEKKAVSKIKTIADF